MRTDRFAIRTVGDGALLLELVDVPENSAWRQVEIAFEMLRQRALPGVFNLHPGERSLLVDLDPRLADPAEVEREIVRTLAAATPVAVRARRLVEIPVCYEPPCAPDLADLAALHRVSIKEVVRAHSEAAYTVHFLGFTAGFPYLGGLLAALVTPRLTTPRKRVAPGSVAIGGHFTGIYPSATAGGWRLIGRTPLRLFDLDATPPNTLQLGDEVRFRPIPLSEFDRS